MAYFGGILIKQNPGSSTCLYSPGHKYSWLGALHPRSNSFHTAQTAEQVPARPYCVLSGQQPLKEGIAVESGKRFPTLVLGLRVTSTQVKNHSWHS